jgi:hypothetical protein
MPDPDLGELGRPGRVANLDGIGARHRCRDHLGLFGGGTEVDGLFDQGHGVYSLAQGVERLMVMLLRDSRASSGLLQVLASPRRKVMAAIMLRSSRQIGRVARP